MDSAKLRKLRKRSYRAAYARQKVEQGLAFQLRELRLERGMTQAELAAQLGLRGQSAIARLEDPAYGKMSLQTLMKLAEVFDVALLTKFVPFSKFLAETHDVRPEALRVLSFEAEDKAGVLTHLQATLTNTTIANANVVVDNAVGYVVSLTNADMSWSISATNFVHVHELNIPTPQDSEVPNVI
ncbi:helix-turn-helix transcriptional regulator [Paraburkholderia nemoris]|uniref:helix-turn-helix transcriptional regulator n=1 Tax=Paraburkholderia nemoris TaxID=2793076 RepID=UPI0038BDE87D